MNFVTPREIYKIDLTDLSQELFWKEDLDGYDSNKYVSEFTFYKSKDGAGTLKKGSYSSFQGGSPGLGKGKS